MKFIEEDILLRIFISEKTVFEGKPLYEKVILKAKELGLAGATALRGILGYGSDKKIHASKIIELSLDLPIIIEIIDTEDNIQKMMPFLDHAITDGFMTMEKIKVIQYRNR